METKLNLPVADVQDPKFAAEFDKAWKETGFAAVVNYDSQVDELHGKMGQAFMTFCALPEEVKMKYSHPELYGQRGYTPNGVEDSGSMDGQEFQAQEWREHFAIGPYIPEDHPLSGLGGHYYHPNFPVDEVPALVKVGEEFSEALELENMKVFDAVALVQGKDKGTYSSKMAYGDSLLRLHFYPRVEGKILGTDTVNGVDSIKVLVDGEEKNLVRAGRHTDINFSTSLMGANTSGLCIEARDGSVIRYTMKEGQIVYNAADFAPWEVPGYVSSFHWVGLRPEEAQQDRYSVVRFNHLRSTVMAGKKGDKERAGVKLIKRLLDIGYGTEEATAQTIKMVNSFPSDNTIVEAILKWERDQKPRVNKLSKYYK